MDFLHQRGVQYAIIAIGLLVAAWWLACLFVFPYFAKEPSVEELRAVVARGSSPEGGPIDADLARQCALAADKLGALRDEESMSVLLKAMEDPDPQVRGRAGAAVRSILHVDHLFRADAPPEERKKLVDMIRREWETYLVARDKAQEKAPPKQRPRLKPGPKT